MLLNPPLVSGIRKVLEDRRDRAASRQTQESLKDNPSIARIANQGGRINENELFFVAIKFAAKRGRTASVTEESQDSKN